MGQYFIAINLDKREYVHADRIGGGLKLWEWCVNSTAGIFPYLLRQSSEGGGGDMRHIDRCIYAGRWAGDRIALVGDYDESKLYDTAQDDYTDISEGLVEEYNVFIEVKERTLTYRPKE